MNCPSCGAAMRTDNGIFKCDYCHNVVVPEHNEDGVSVTSASGSQNCPVCTLPLMQATLGKVPLLYCTKCDGMLVAMEQFEMLIAADRSRPGSAVSIPANPADLRRSIACPHCHRPMEAHFYGGAGNVVIDTCENCCLNWLDRGELSRIAHAPQSEHNPETDIEGDDHARYAASTYDPTADEFGTASYQ